VAQILLDQNELLMERSKVAMGNYESNGETRFSPTGRPFHCLRDRPITVGLQRAMQTKSPCQQTFSIDTDHSPFSSAPEQLADILSQVAKE
jgi:hypothetical protein